MTLNKFPFIWHNDENSNKKKIFMCKIFLAPFTLCRSALSHSSCPSGNTLPSKETVITHRFILGWWRSSRNSRTGLLVDMRWRGVGAHLLGKMSTAPKDGGQKGYTKHDPEPYITDSLFSYSLKIPPTKSRAIQYNGFHVPGSPTRRQ